MKLIVINDIGDAILKSNITHANVDIETEYVDIEVDRLDLPIYRAPSRHTLTVSGILVPNNEGRHTVVYPANDYQQEIVWNNL